MEEGRQHERHVAESEHQRWNVTAGQKGRRRVSDQHSMLLGGPFRRLGGHTRGPSSETPSRSLPRPRCRAPNSIDVTEFPCVKSCLGLCRILGGHGGDNIFENIEGFRTKGHDYWNMGCPGTRRRNAAEGLSSLRCRSPLRTRSESTRR